MQNFLRKVMQTIGRPFEKLGKSSPKTGQARTSSSVASGERTAEITLPEVRIRRVLETLEGQEVASMLPNLSGKKVLHATASGTRQWELLQQKGAKLIIDFDVNPLFGPQATMSTRPAYVQPAKGSFSAAPFPDDAFEFFLLFGATPRSEQLTGWIPEIARVLREGSRAVLSMIHPYLTHQMNPRAGFPQDIGKQFMELRRAGIYVEEIKEVKAEDSVRSLFGPAKDDKDFAQIKGYPMLVFFKGVRLKRR
jgi:hypothetical protein